VPHIINNAYGVQSVQLCSRVSRACRGGRVDLLIQSTDKNFMVPVGGTVAAATAARPEVLRAMAQRYPGRAAVAAHLDLAATLLHLGRRGWARALAAREALYGYLLVRPRARRLCIVAQAFQEIQPSGVWCKELMNWL
jgi:O-phospho-L-seryl-tRNASec:L-selenocysteinyl-tRNA synthase